MAEDSDLEKTEPASARRLEQAREEGNVPQSRELMAFMVLAAGAGTFWVLGGWIAGAAASLVRDGLSFSRGAAFDTSVMNESALVLTIDAFRLAGPIFLVIIAAVIATPYIMGGPAMSAKAFQLDLTRLDPVKGLGRMFSWHSVAELLKAVLKALLVGGILWWIVRHEQDRLFSLITQPIEVGLASFSQLLFFSFVALIAGLAIIAAIDVPFQLWQYHDRLKMTREELRQEHKESEGDPQLKARIRSQQREIARGRMMAEVPKADVVVTNPTHFAVALKYDGDSMAAPVVVAKGMNLVADRIRELATENRVPLLEAPPLARALYRHGEVGDAIPAALYSAVAEVMAWVYQLNDHAADVAAKALPMAPTLIAVPDGLDPGTPA
ncbi:MAG: flagellar type III secretion system protein FlhB [Sterolibacteriaceae bacterium]|uniref:flagellar biosynthesis protein FlhB n=1 Tax=Sulfuritalea sp. TaxID=2480090 RepID=UPI001A566E45|nr:flagellar biosynthesis protein FlhB [Sulfuritalea sp.]MBL8477756.1 flagellar type III secretion system protein FlhB [Sterolibacteriaceae bacterium]MBN8474827.1 flagellar type III secretion system protein FlhB [Sulfuritalea sp.]